MTDKLFRNLPEYNSAVLLYGCDNWSFILWEEHRLRAFVNLVLRRHEVPGDCVKLHNEFHDIYSSPNIIQ
jgi:hypothetical protein